MTEGPKPSQKPRSDSAHTAAERPVLGISLGCIACGYELKGLPFHGQCPECGKSIEHSLATIPEADRSAVGVRKALKFINAGWLTSAILLLGCFDGFVALFICLMGAGLRASGYRIIARGSRGSNFDETRRLRWQAVVCGLVALGLVTALGLTVATLVNPISAELDRASRLANLITLCLLCAEGAVWMFGVKCWARDNAYPALGPTATVALLAWSIPACLTLLLLVVGGWIADANTLRGALTLSMIVLIILCSIGNALIGNLFSDLIHQLEVQPQEREENDLAVRLRNAQEIEKPEEPGPSIRPADSATAEIIPQHGGITPKQESERKRESDPPRNPGGTY